MAYFFMIVKKKWFSCELKTIYIPYDFATQYTQKYTLEISNFSYLKFSLYYYIYNGSIHVKDIQCSK